MNWQAIASNNNYDKNNHLALLYNAYEHIYSQEKKIVINMRVK